MADLETGDKAPQFTLPAVNLEKIGRKGDEVSLADFEGKKIVVLYFYPRDMTSGCTKQAVGFRDLKGQFTRNDAVVLGVSTDSIERHGKFVDKNRLNFALLSDEDAEVADRYGVWQERKKVADRYGVWQERKSGGKTRMGTVRTTFVIERAGRIANIWRRVKAVDNAREVLDFVKTMQ